MTGRAMTIPNQILRFPFALRLNDTAGKCGTETALYFIEISRGSFSACPQAIFHQRIWRQI
jgi:hypothetical protein